MSSIAGNRQVVEVDLGFLNTVGPNSTPDARNSNLAKIRLIEKILTSLQPCAVTNRRNSTKRRYPAAPFWEELTRRLMQFPDLLYNTNTSQTRLFELDDSERFVRRRHYGRRWGPILTMSSILSPVSSIQPACFFGGPSIHSV
jgi:hypothetical protein